MCLALHLLIGQMSQFKSFEIGDGILCTKDDVKKICPSTP
jgi:hypothetical protein